MQWKIKPTIVPQRNQKSDLYHTWQTKVMLDSDLSATFVSGGNKNLKKAVKRNINRFPVSFCFQLTEKKLKT